MDKRYQVFVSSTYADLKDERKRVIQALMEMDCIPAGMELFPATDDEQWAFIKRIIDDCDYYLIIIGGRYGSTTPDGISYTEKEFDYALAKGLKVIALLHEDPDSIPVSKSDIDPVLRHKLKTFREKVATNRLVKFWKTAEELPGMVALSLSKTIKTYPAVGWVRASTVASNEMLMEINELRKQNDQLRLELQQNAAKQPAQIEGLAGLDSMFKVKGSKRVFAGHGSGFYDRPWEVTITWRKLFSLLAPFLMDSPTENALKKHFDNIATKEAKEEGYADTQVFKTVGLQLRALGLIDISYLETTQGGMALFWSLTPAGERLMMEERTIKANTPQK